MNKFMILIICLFPFPLNIYSVADDSVFVVGAEDDWGNTDQYIDTIKKEIREKILSIYDSVELPLRGKAVIRFSISKEGCIFNSNIEKGLNRYIDSILLNVLDSLKFQNAPLYDNKGNPHSINFVLPVKIDIPTEKDSLSLFKHSK